MNKKSTAGKGEESENAAVAGDQGRLAKAPRTGVTVVDDADAYNASSLLSRQDLQRVADEIGQDYPYTLERTMVLLLEVDPFRFQAYWNLLSEDLKRGQAMFPSPVDAVQLVLRVRPLGQSDLNDSNRVEAHVFDVDVPDMQGELPIDVWTQARSYEAELGLRSSDGGWLSLARSNHVRLPEPQAKVEADLDLCAPKELTSDAEVALVPVFPLADLETKDDARREAGETQIVSGTEPNRAVWEPSFGPPIEDGLPGADDPDLTIPLDPMPEEPAARSTAPPRLSDLGENRSVQLQLATRPIEQGTRAAALQQLPSSPGGSDQYLLELSADLLIHGRTRPGQVLVLFGQRVEAGPDGTFTIRRPLPNGDALIPLLLGSVAPR